jgi:chromosome segregation ATPase
MTALSAKLEVSQTVVGAKDKQISDRTRQNTSTVQKHKAEIAAKDKQFSDLTAQIASAVQKHKAEIAAKDTQIVSAVVEKDKLHAIAARQQKQLSDFTAQKAQLQGELESSNARVTAQSAYISDLEAKVSCRERERDQLRECLRGIKQGLGGSKGRSGQLRDQIALLRGQVIDLTERHRGVAHISKLLGSQSVHQGKTILSLEKQISEQQHEIANQRTLVEHWVKQHRTASQASLLITAERDRVQVGLEQVREERERLAKGLQASHARCESQATRITDLETEIAQLEATIGGLNGLVGRHRRCLIQIKSEIQKLENGPGS